MPGRLRDDVFLSIFPRPSFTTPTPETTPNIGAFSSPGWSFGGPNASAGHADESVRFNRAWSVITRFLALVVPVFKSPSDIDKEQFCPDVETIEAFALVLNTASKELASWYGNEISLHFLNMVLPELGVWQHHVPSKEALSVLQMTLKILRQVQHLYLARLESLAKMVLSKPSTDQATLLVKGVRASLHSMFLHSFPRLRFQSVLRLVMFESLLSSLERYSHPDKCKKEGQCCCYATIDDLPLRELSELGLGHPIASRAFAQAIDKFLKGPAIERRCFEVDWTTQTTVMPKLRNWLSKQVVPMIHHSLHALGDDAIDAYDKEDLSCSVVMHLGRLRTLSVFEYVKTWPSSAGAIQDIREYLSSDSVALEKVHLCNSFSDQIQRRLLHAGASTAEILGIYVNVIHAFKALDSRGVLLERVAIPIRHYLRARDDFVPIIAASFLAEMDQDESVKAADPDKICPDITMEVANSTVEDLYDQKKLDWDDMQWVPDPIDAGPGYKASKSEDVIAYILDLFEQDEFIKEVTSVLAQHLLDATDPEYVKEIRLVELFKSRLDASKLQAIEVMLKDMQYSVKLGKRINPFANYAVAQGAPTPNEIKDAIPKEGITLAELYSQFSNRIKQAQFIAAVKLIANKRNDLFFAKRTRIPADAKKKDATNFKAQILSSFFWPQLRSNEYNLPTSLQALNSSFEQRFESLGTQQKLHFRPGLARVSVHLELEDRTIDETEVPGSRTSVIDLFASESGLTGRLEATQYNDATGLTPEQISEALSMEEELVQDALNFWTNKQVLYRRLSGSYAVLERLDMEVEVARPEIVQSDDNHILAIKSQDAMLRESAPMFSTFIANMLRNQGPKEVGGVMGITSLLKMVLPSFTYGDEEIRWLLGQMESRGEILREGEKWKVAS
jgi:anaphase-promoting complex subunit 2